MTDPTQPHDGGQGQTDGSRVQPHPLDPAQLPSLQSLHRASLAAVLLAAVLGVTVVLPAETGSDPTGVGAALGLTAMGEMRDAPLPAAQEAPPADVFAFRTDDLTLTLQPNQGTEIKAVMRRGDQLTYTWTADQGELFFDFHGEPEGAASDVFTSFEKGTLATAKGDHDAPFTGTHGWYWKNRTDAPITLTLHTSGVYSTIGRK